MRKAEARDGGEQNGSRWKVRQAGHQHGKHSPSRHEANKFHFQQLPGEEIRVGPRSPPCRLCDGASAPPFSGHPVFHLSTGLPDCVASDFLPSSYPRRSPFPRVLPLRRRQSAGVGTNTDSGSSATAAPSHSPCTLLVSGALVRSP